MTLNYSAKIKVDAKEKTKAIFDSLSIDNKFYPENPTKTQISYDGKITGDYQQLSKQDMSSVALCLQLNGELISDDFAVSNVAKNLGLKVNPSMTSGIKDVGNWIYYCAGCHKNFQNKSECPLCGNKLRRKLLKAKSSTIQVNK